ncbi:glycosyltransferase family 2 protein [Methylobacterium sp. Leaf118]|uniref:glycosyltransferase family 2 protein n=1 Tax=Methylobacterium sp. Leaf118 TaxID=2876562 RepID=UPI001E3AFC71|nr:glycosyltransferase [Methylobacterium sp. Leaf118]
MSSISVVTLNKGREAHLARLIEGLARGPAPAECIVVEMGPDPAPLPPAPSTPASLPPTPFPTRRIAFPSAGLPLAAARNAGRAAASGDLLVYLDVDCIPASGLVTALAAAAQAQDGLVCGPIRYLPAGAVRDGWSEAELMHAGVLHPARPFPESGVVTTPNPGLFWSLSFAVRAATWDRLGGFDEGFDGYGAEDTDLAFRAAASGVPVLLAGTPPAFHQHHLSCDPPLQHFSDIVRNARRFRARHGLWPMDGWLDAFARLGLIAPEREPDIVVLRPPTPAEIAAAQVPADRPF